MAIGRVAGPMLLQELDRQGIDLTFTTNSNELVNLDFTNFRMALRGTSGGPYVFNVNGNAAIGNVVLDAGALVTTQGLNQNLTLQANGIANVTVINANVISGRVDGTVIGGLNPSIGTFTYLNANVLGTFATANISNLSADRIPFTASNNNVLMDSAGLKFFNANSALIVANLTVIGTQTFDTITPANLAILNSNPTSIAYIAANNWVVTTTNLTFFNSNSLLRTGNIRLDNVNTNQVLFADSAENRKIKGTNNLTYDGENLRANGITRLGDVEALNNRIRTANTNQDLILDPNGSGVITVNNHRVTDVGTPTLASDAATKSYVDALISVTAASTRSIFDGPVGRSRVIVNDNSDAGGTFVGNVIFSVRGVEQGRIEDGLVTWQDITIADNTISTVAGELKLNAYNNDRVVVDTNSALRLPVGVEAERPTPGLEQTGDLRFNTDLGSIEWYDGANWNNPTTNVIASETIVPDGTSASFTLAQENTTTSVLVNFNGVIQRPSTTYTVAGNIITFSTVPLTTDIIEIRSLAAGISVATNPIVVDTAYANVGVSTFTVDSWDIHLYRAAKYTYTAKTVTGDNYEIGELYVVHDDLAGYHTSTFTSKSGLSMLTWTTEVSFTAIMNIKAQGTNADTQIKYHAMYITDPAI
jgi:hypothetical protein